MLFSRKNIVFLLLLLLAGAYVPCDLIAKNYNITMPDGKQKNISTKNVNGSEVVRFDILVKTIWPQAKLKSKSRSQIGSKILKCASGSFFLVCESHRELYMAQMSSPAFKMNHRMYLPFKSFMKSLFALKMYNTKFSKNKITLTSIQQQIHTSERIPFAVKEEIQNEAIKRKTDLPAFPELKAKKEIHIPKITKKISKVGIDARKKNKPSSVKASFFSAFNTTSKILRNSLKHLKPTVPVKKPTDVTKKKKSMRDIPPFPPNRYILPKKLVRTEIDSLTN